jgi:hypothetical protein
MVLKKNNNLKNIMEKNLTPVEGIGGENIIGHWDELNNKFIPISDEVLEKFIKYKWYIHPILPLIIQITKEKIDGVYHTYRSFGTNNERTIINKNKI